MTDQQANPDQARAVLARMYQACIDSAVCASWLAQFWREDQAMYQEIADEANREAKRIAELLEEMGNDK